MDKTSPEEEILKKLQVLEQDHAHLMQELSLFRHHHSYSYAQQECQRVHSRFSSSVPRRPLTLSFNKLQLIGHSVHIFDLICRIIYWSKTATNLYGNSVGEALGQSALELLADPQVVKVGNSVVQRLTKWVATFSALMTNTPFYDDEGIFIGVICASRVICALPRKQDPPMLEVEFTKPDSSSGSIAPEVGGLVDTQQPVQNAIASKFTNLASKISNKVKSRIKAGIDHMDYKLKGGDSHQFHHWEEGDSSGASHVSPSPFGVFSKLKQKFPGKPSRDHDDSAGKHPMHKIITSKAEAWIDKKGMSWPWKENEQEVSEAGNDDLAFPWLHSLNENDSIPGKSNYGLSPEDQTNDMNLLNTSNNASFCHGDVAIKIFFKQEYPDDVLLSFRQEVIGAVGYMNQRLEIPNDVDPQLASIIESCWCSDPATRPTFLELLDKLKALHIQCNLQLKAAHSTSKERTQEELYLSKSSFCHRVSLMIHSIGR